METRINSKTVSHIDIYDLEATGYIWCDEIKEKKVFFNLISLNDAYEEGYWYNGYQGFFGEKLDKSKNYMRNVNGEIYFIPHISIFCGQEKIKTIYFETFEEAKEYCDKNYGEVNVIC